MAWARLVLVGLALIAFFLGFNLWSQKQRAIDDLAEDLSWAITHLLNRNPRPSTAAEVAKWEEDFTKWCDRVSLPQGVALGRNKGCR